VIRRPGPVDHQESVLAGPKSILWAHGGPDDGRKIQLDSELALIGRASSNDIIVDDAEVSRQHAGIRGDRNGHWIKDLGSRNGTFVNGELLEGEDKDSATTIE